MRQLIFNLTEESLTSRLGAALAQVLSPGIKLYLHGDLGTGKTTLTRALIQASGYSGTVKSPTFNLAEPYDITVSQQPVKLMHFDLYRMDNPQEFLDAGFREHFDNDTICIVEWPENAEKLLPEPDMRILFYVNGMGRKLILQGITEKGDDSLKHLRFDTDA